MGKYFEIYQNALTIEAESISAMAKRLDQGVFEQIVDLLSTVKPRGKKVILAGCGTSGAAAKKISHTLNVVEVPSFFLSPADSVHGGLGAVQQGDIVVLISKGGNTGELVNYIPVCREKQATIIAVCEDPNSTLARNADIFLRVWVDREPCPWNMVATASTLTVIAVWDAIALAVMSINGFTKEQFCLIHPSGAVGDRLRRDCDKREEDK